MTAPAPVIQLCDPRECAADRSTGEPLVPLVDMDGEILFKFPAPWSDAQIMYALTFANHAFRQGYEAGQALLQIQLQQLLGVRR